MTLQLLLSLCICGGILLLTRLYYVLPVFNQPTRYVSKRRKGKTSVHQSSEKMLCVVLGSGGHTAEMVRLLQGVEFDRFMERLYIVSNNDTLSLDQISLVENHGNVYNGEYYVERVPRSREVGQPWTSALLSAASCLRRA
ncbi:metalloprotease, partial [Coemansia sp. RSA 1290]